MERANQRAYRNANLLKARERERAHQQRRRASTKTSVSEAPTAEQLTALLADPCIYCGADSAHIDHIIPLSRGGTHTLDNLAPACAPCNLSKGAKLPGIEWKGRKIKTALDSEPIDVT